MAKRKKRQKKTRYNVPIIAFVIIIIALFTVYFLNRNQINLSLRSDIIDRSFQETENPPYNDVEGAILYSIQQLKVPDRYIRRKDLDEETRFSIGISKNILDLNYANMIITSHVELMGGTILDGRESDNYRNQYLEIYDQANDMIYNLNLYYRSYQVKDSDKTLLAIIVDDFGYYGGDLLDDFNQLDSNITFAILPGLENSTDVMFVAESGGHETIIHMPMEPLNYPRNNPGPDAIYVHMTNNEIRRKMQFYFDQLPLCAGANNHMGSLVTADKDVMKIVLEELKKRGLFFVDSRTSQSSVAYSLAQEMMIPSLENNLFLDTPDTSDATLDLKINRLSSLQKKHDKLVVITHCSNSKKLAYLKKFLSRIESMDFKLVPVSRLLESDIPDIL